MDSARDRPEPARTRSSCSRRRSERRRRRRRAAALRRQRSVTSPGAPGRPSRCTRCASQRRALRSRAVAPARRPAAARRTVSTARRGLGSNDGERRGRDRPVTDRGCAAAADGDGRGRIRGRGAGALQPVRASPGRPRDEVAHDLHARRDACRRRLLARDPSPATARASRPAPRPRPQVAARDPLARRPPRPAGTSARSSRRPGTVEQLPGVAVEARPGAPKSGRCPTASWRSRPVPSLWR